MTNPKLKSDADAFFADVLAMVGMFRGQVAKRESAVYALIDKHFGQTYDERDLLKGTKNEHL